jgi:putative serine protease PepD
MTPMDPGPAAGSVDVMVPFAACVRRSAAVVALALLAATSGACGSAQTTTVTVTRPSTAVGRAAVDSVDERLVQVVRGLAPRVVQIETAEGLGSGVIYDRRGNIVTNAHVVGSSTTFTVTLAGGQRHRATLVGTFMADDLAVIRLAPVPSPAPTPARFGDSAKTRVGQHVLAIGNPLGLRSSVTDGIVSSLGRTVPEGNGVVIMSAIQISASINPGNSGGAVGNLDGDVIGIPTLAAVDPELGGSEAPGIGFAIPSNTVRSIAAQLIARGKVMNNGRADLGIDVATTTTGQGVAVMAVRKDGPAAGAQLRRGDVLTTVAGRPTPTTDALATVLARLRPGTVVAVAFRRPGGARMTARVRLGQRPGTS